MSAIVQHSHLATNYATSNQLELLINSDV